MSFLINACEREWIPDLLTRIGMRFLIRQRLRQQRIGGSADIAERQSRFLDSLRQGAIAESTADANAQHYEVPAEFFQRVLGPRLKYSSCLFDGDETDLAAAEDAMLALTCQRAGLVDGERILELGSGWGSLSLWMAEHYPNCSIHAVSNSTSQQAFVQTQAAERGLSNLTVHVADMNDFQPAIACGPQAFDRVVSVEMFEHMRNYARLLDVVRDAVHDEGTLFVHIFCHREFGYAYEDEGAGDWMARNFFSGGIMPRFDIFEHFPEHVAVDQSWYVSGRHYAQTLRCWLHRLDTQRALVDELLAVGSPDELAAVRAQRWRMFMMACEELFALDGGDSYGVGHYRLRIR